jgi:hypothetical protein
MNSSGPLGGSGHAHHRKTTRCELPPPPLDRRIGPAGSAPAGLGHVPSGSAVKG